MEEIIFVMVRTAAIYFFIVLAIRLFGKKELSQLSVVDLVFILLISNSVQNAMVGGNTSLIGGLAAATTLFIINFTLKYLFYRSRKLSSFFQGIPLMLIYNGKIVQHHLDQAKISREELKAAIREHGVENFEEVNLAVLEIDGNISVLSENFHRKTTKHRKANKIISANS